MTTKTCRDCGNTYPKTPEFWNVRNRGVDRAPEYNVRCKTCDAAYTKARRIKYSNSLNISNRTKPRRKKVHITEDTVWQIALHIRYDDRAEVRPIVTGCYGYLRPVFDQTHHPRTRDFDGATEAYMALEPVS